MLEKLRQVASEGTLRIEHAYLGHIKKDEDRKYLAHAEAMDWEDVEPTVRSIFEQHLHQALEGALGEVNFPCMYTGDVLAIDKVASPELDRTQNRPAVEVLEALHDMREINHDSMLEMGNVLAYKVLAAGAIKNHLLGILRLQVVPELGAAPITFVFATLTDLDDREESLFDELRGKFITTMLNNVVKRGAVSRAVFFPCLDEDGREMADLLVYAGSGAGAWFKALEATRRFSPRREGQTLVRMITEQSSGGAVPHDIFQKMGEQLLPQVSAGLEAESVVDSIEKALGHGIDRKGFLSRWESSFGDAGYRPSYASLFGGDEVEKPTRLKMQAGEILITLHPSHLEHFRQVTVGKQSFIVFAVPDSAKVLVGKDLNMKIKPVELEDLKTWIESKAPARD